MPLIVTCAPEADECAQGYFRRLAEANRLGNWKALAIHAQVSAGRTGLLGNLTHVGAVLGLDPQWTREIEQRERQALALQRLRRTGHDTYCPSCLSDRAYIRASWDHALATACAVHGSMLIDRCSHCHEPLPTTRPHLTHCDCGHDLRKSPTEPAPPSQRWLSNLLAGAGADLPAPALRQPDVRQLGALVRALCGQHDPTRPPPPRNFAPPKSVAEAVVFLQPLTPLLAAWPEGFRAHVAERLAVSPLGATTLNVALGAWYRDVKRACTRTALQPFLDQVLTEASERFAGIIGLDAAGQPVTAEDPLVLLKQAAQRLGVGRDTLARAMDEGLLKGERRKLGNRRLAYFVRESELTRLHQARSGWVDEAQAQALLRVPPSILESLTQCGALKADPRWRNDIHKAGPYELAAAKALLDRLRSGHVAGAPKSDTIKLRDLTSRRVGDKQARAAAFGAITKGEITSVGPMPAQGIGELQYLMSDVRRYFGTPLLESGLTVQQLCDQAGWKFESVSHWLDTGLMDSETVMLRGQPCRVVLPAQLLRFNREYIPLADAAKLLSTKSSAMARYLPGLELVGAKSQPNGVRRGGLLRLADVLQRAAGLPGGHGSMAGMGMDSAQGGG